MEITSKSYLSPLSIPKADGKFNVYDDVKSKLIEHGVPAEEIAFIHDAASETQKKELFAKVRSGKVRVLLGSTAKMGAGTNVQDRLIAVHHLDVGWRPSDMTQRNGRIIRQGNRNEQVQVYQYVTEGTFDAYLYQTLENKQKFISQIMTSKSPVRSCDDIDESVLSFAEIKALCAGDPRIKEKMDLDIEVARLKLMKADHNSKQYRLEDNVLIHFPAQIKMLEAQISGYQADMEMLDANKAPEGEFSGMTLMGRKLEEKDKAGEALLAVCRAAPRNAELSVGAYRGMDLTVGYDVFSNDVVLTLKGKMSYGVVMGPDARGNLLRIENALKGLPVRLEQTKDKLENVHQQIETAKAEIGKPFPQEEEMKTKSARLAVLDSELDMDAKPQQKQEHEEKPSIMEALKKPVKEERASAREAGKEKER